jgi:hypothetical protein
MEESNREFPPKVMPTITPDTLRELISFVTVEIDNLRKDTKALVMTRKDMMRQLKEAEAEVAELESQWLMEVE